jgi:hypothetical protein
MACRLLNLHHSVLHVDLRGGHRLVLAPGARSAVLREEWLYDNHHLADWERAGWIQRLPARLSDDALPAPLPAAPGPAAPRRKPAAAARPKAAQAASTTSRKNAR